jgi:trehalose 6-phosphate synthase/phosphatase
MNEQRDRARRLLVVSNRLPFTAVEKDGELAFEPSAGGLVSGLTGYLESAGKAGTINEYLWVGWPGSSVEPDKQATLERKARELNAHPVFISEVEMENFYYGFCNSTIWPLFHYFPSYAEYRMDEYPHYMKVNQQFAEILYRNCAAGDTIWIHDYHLLPLAQMMRELIPEISIGVFLHIPFPSFEIFRLLPRKWQEGIMKGMLGADLIGFHTIDYASHFLQSIQMILGVDNERNIIRYNDRLIKVDCWILCATSCQTAPLQPGTPTQKKSENSSPECCK